MHQPQMHIDTFTGAGLTRLCGGNARALASARCTSGALWGCASSCRDNIGRYPDRGIYTPPILSHGGTNTLFAATPRRLIEEGGGVS